MERKHYSPYHPEVYEAAGISPWNLIKKDTAVWNLAWLSMPALDGLAEEGLTTSQASALVDTYKLATMKNLKSFTFTDGVTVESLMGFNATGFVHALCQYILPIEDTPHLDNFLWKPLGGAEWILTMTQRAAQADGLLAGGRTDNVQVVDFVNRRRVL